MERATKGEKEMTVTRVKRLVNPRRGAGKKRMSDKQIRHFGTKAQRAGLKRRSAAKRATRPVRKAVAHRRTANPASLITLGLVNPHKARKGKTTVAKTKKRRAILKAPRTANPHRSYARTKRRASTKRRSNGTRVYITRRNGRRRGGAKRNPAVFGMTGSAAGKAILAGLVGVYATKTVTPMVAGAIPSVGGSAVVSALISGVVAWGGGMLLSKWDKTAGEGFMFGGLMQAGSQLLNLVVPANPLALSGLGDWAGASFPVPQNPIMAAARMRAQGMLPAPGPAVSSNLSGMGAAAMFK